MSARRKMSENMQNIKCLLFIVFATVVAAHGNIGADKTPEKEEWRNLEETLDQDSQKSPENVHCRLRPESPLCRAENKKAFLSRLFNSWKDEARAKLQSGHADRKRDNKKCRPRPGSPWCTGKREFESFRSPQNGEMTKPGFTDIKKDEDDKIASVQERLGEERTRM